MKEHIDLNQNNISGTVLADDGTAKSGVPIIVRHVESDTLVIDRAYNKTTDANGEFTIDADNDPIPPTYTSGTETIEMLEIWAEFGDGADTSQGESLYDSGGKARMYPIAYSLQGDSVDDFDDQDLSEYTVVGGDIFGIDTSNPIEGSASLAVTNAGNETDASADLIMSDPGDGLDNYPSKGDIFSVYAYEPGGENTLPMCGFGGSKDDVTGYSLSWFPSSLDIRIRRIDGQGNPTDIASDKSSVYADHIGETVELEGEWHDGSGSEPEDTIVYRVYELDSNLNRGSQIGNTITTTDSSYASQEGVFFSPASSDPENGLYADSYQIQGGV